MAADLKEAQKPTLSVGTARGHAKLEMLQNNPKVKNISLIIPQPL